MKQYAFWKYDLFPYVKWGEVEKLNEDSTVETKNYGAGHKFKPILILEEEEALIYINKIEDISRELRQKQINILGRYKKALKFSLPKLNSHDS